MRKSMILVTFLIGCGAGSSNTTPDQQQQPSKILFQDSTTVKVTLVETPDSDTTTGKSLVVPGAPDNKTIINLNYVIQTTPAPAPQQ